MKRTLGGYLGRRQVTYVSEYPHLYLVPLELKTMTICIVELNRNGQLGNELGNANQ